MCRLACLSILAFAFTALGDDKPPTPREANDLRQQYERQMQDFQKSIDSLKDNPEAREALEKARDEYKKGMEARLKEADKVVPPAPAEGQPQAPRIFQRFDEDAFRDVEDFQKQMLQDQMRMLEQLRGAQGRGMGRAIAPRSLIGVELAAMPPVLVEQLGLDKSVGVVVAGVAKDSAAEKAGLKANDVLLQIAGKDVPAEPAAVVAQLTRAEPGAKLELTVLRKGKKERIEALEIPAAARRAPGVQFGGGAIILGGNGIQGMSVSVNNGDVSIGGTFEGGLKITVKGTQDERGRIVPEKITVEDGDAKAESYESLDKVPEKYRGQAEKLMGAVGGRR